MTHETFATLKKIGVDRLRVGMHVHELCGSWLEHSFWRKQFVLSDLQELTKLRGSGVAECWIDISKGVDVALDAHATPAPAPTISPPARRAAAPKPVSMEDEAHRARLLCAQAKDTVEALFDQARLGRAIDVDGCTALVDDIAASLQRNAGALSSLVRLKSHDNYTFMHSVAVCTLMISLARRLGHDEEQVREAGLGGMLHDMGKATIALQVLNKPGRLSDGEYTLVKEHPRAGHELLRQAGRVSAIALDVCLHHHERPDGAGYPDGLAGDNISLQARMAAVCDVYDAITSNRPYKDGWGPAESIAQMAQWARAGQFDPAVFRAFVESVGIYPNGSLVRLASERLAVVLEQGARSPIRPRLKVFYSVRSRMPVPVHTLDLASPGCNERIVCRESNRQWQFEFLDRLASES